MSVVRPLPDRPNLANLRKQAKSLLAAWRAADQEALARVRQLHPRGDRLTATGWQSLADAQLVVARGYGFASWARLVQHLRLTPSAQAGYALDRLFQATRGPALDPGHLLEYALIYSAGLGRSAAVELLLGQGPDLTVTEPVWRATAAGLARYHLRHHILALLEAT